MNHVRTNAFHVLRRWARATAQRCLRLSTIGTDEVRSVTLVDVTGGAYAENRPYLVPETLSELSGPVSGIVVLPLRLDWTERAEFHLDNPAERNVMYERVIRESTRIDDLRAYINGAVLNEAWRQLFLPARVRQIWEERFPTLRPTAA